MNILLRKLWILISLMLVVNAEIVFNLDDQQLQNAVGKDSTGQNTDIVQKPSRYNLLKTYVSTALVYKSGGYTLKDNEWGDQFYVEIKNPIEKWNVNFAVSCFFGHIPHTIKFISDTGKTITIGMLTTIPDDNQGKIYFNSPENSTTIDLHYWEDVVGSVSMNGESVSFNVKGVSKTITVPNFSKLKYVSISILEGEYSFQKYSILKSLTIGSGD